MMGLIICAVVEKYGVTQVEKNGVRHNVGSRWYEEHKNDQIGGFEIEEDFLEDGKTLKIKA